MRRAWKPLLAVSALALAGCAAPSDPQVTFYSHGSAVSVPPAQYCEDPAGEECSPPDPEAVGTLRVPGDSVLQISVPAEVADAPWQVVFLYRGPDGELLDSRTQVFPPGERHAYTLQLPPDGTRLEHVEVQKFSAVLTPNQGGGVSFGIGGTWVLSVRQ
ncbi:DUF2771 family protein [Saccharopolyspora rectivirgula]|uniref:DUF2771 domain-containing protein n=1 Tax=Saccharopolyspora rectivirgula TaxID=28042 RepID=A0A073BCF4_9PSEU|nr:DUF2771 family protein [Saccharopolyspora rectivirgula]KEI45459.1 hypothetical protein GU90_03175 [Saccharopolyspora rectivirgula]